MIKEGDTIYFPFFRKGLANILGQIMRKPQFTVLNGIVKCIIEEKDKPKICSIEIEKWPLRYLTEETNCFLTKDLAEEKIKQLQKEYKC